MSFFVSLYVCFFLCLFIRKKEMSDLIKLQNFNFKKLIARVSNSISLAQLSHSLLSGLLKNFKRSISVLELVFLFCCSLVLFSLFSLSLSSFFLTLYSVFSFLFYVFSFLFSLFFLFSLYKKVSYNYVNIYTFLKIVK